MAERSGKASRPGSRARTILLVPLLALALVIPGVLWLKGQQPTPHAPATPTAAPGTSTPTMAAPIVGGRLLFRRYTDRAQTTGSLFTSTADGRLEEQVTHAGPGSVDQSASWSRDGKRIVFSRNERVGTDAEVDGLLTVRPDGSGLTRLTTGNNNALTDVSYDDFPTFSPDGRSIAYAHLRGDVRNDVIQHSDVAVMRADGTRPRLLTNLREYGGNVAGIAWSPDGRRLVYGYDDAVNERFALFIVGADGTGNHRITDWTPGLGGQADDWTARGNLIAFRVVTDVQSGTGNFYTVYPDGSGRLQATRLDNRKISHKASFSPDGRWLAFAAADADAGPNDLYLGTLDGGVLRRVKATGNEESGPSWGPAG